MKNIEETFKVEKEILEEFFEDRVIFVSSGIAGRYMLSKNVYPKGKRDVKFLEEKTKVFLLYLHSKIVKEEGDGVIMRRKKYN